MMHTRKSNHRNGNTLQQNMMNALALATSARTALYLNMFLVQFFRAIAPIRKLPNAMGTTRGAKSLPNYYFYF